MIYLLDADNPHAPFPDTAQAELEPDGLLAVGGDLSTDRLLNAYRRGIFPWYSAGQPILWWAPATRLVLYPEELHVARSLRKTLRRGRFDVSMDRAFEAVISACAAPRDGDPGTWLTPEMIRAYARLHQLGYAHSVETWLDGDLVGGLYGIALGRVFFGESMFSLVPNASKVALVALAERLGQAGYRLIDCQVYTEHLERMGARSIGRAGFEAELQAHVTRPGLADWPRGPESTRERTALGISA
jgi:leucyl/phenylalanyl-tRNA--protein transferase